MMEIHQYKSNQNSIKDLTKWGRISDRMSHGRSNNMDAIRFAAALLVIISHSFAIAGYPEPKIGDYTLGFIGVAIFSL